MKIVHILNYVHDCGNGIICATIDLACEQSRQGQEVYVISGGGDFSKILESCDVKHILINQKRRPLNMLRAIMHLHKAISEIQPDVVHAHMITSVVLAKLMKCFQKFLLVSTIHNEFQKTAVLMGLADRVIAVSSGVKKTMHKRGIPSNKMYIVKNGTIGGIREKISDLDENSGITLKRPSITTIAGLYERKGISCLIKSFDILHKSFPDAHLYIVGDGPDKKKFLLEASNTSCSQNIHFEGFQKNIKNYLTQTDAFVLASTSETFGLALSEARKAGCAAFGSYVGGIPDVLEDGNAGQLFEPEDCEELAMLLRDTLADPKKLSFWQKRAKENLDWLKVERVCKQTMMVYSS